MVAGRLFETIQVFIEELHNRGPVAESPTSLTMETESTA